MPSLCYHFDPLHSYVRSSYGCYQESCSGPGYQNMYKRCRIFFFFLFLTIIALGAKAQSNLRFSAYMDAGESNVSEGLYLKTSLLGSLQQGKYTLNAGGQLNVIYPVGKVFSAAKITGGRMLSIKKFNFEIQGLFIYNSISENIFETNYGILFLIGRKHFDFQLGTNFRGYHLSKLYRKENGYDGDHTIREKWNVIYLIAYNVKPPDHNWNAGITLTNIDHFMISQETNPMINLHGNYQISDPIMIYTEAWYKSAGALNISVNYFGFFIRTGLIWRIDLTKK